MKNDSYFAIQHKECFVYFGAAPVTSLAATDGQSLAATDGQVCTMGGYVATLVELDRKDGYIWSPMPQLNLQQGYGLNVTKSVKICGGYTSGDKIKLFGLVYEQENNPGSMYFSSNCTTNCWTTSLTMPTSHWSEITTTAVVPKGIIPPFNKLAAVQKCKRYVVYFYLPDQYYYKLEGTVVMAAENLLSLKSQSRIMVIDEEKKQSCLFLTDSVTFDGHVSCAVVGDDLFVVNEDKMAQVEKFTHLLVASASIDQNTTFSISFDLTVPHANGTLFAVHNTLCVVGGCDDKYEPFSEIYQFDQQTKEWNECGVSSVSRYGASVVVFTDRNQREGVFIAGGFKGKDMPCSIIEVLAVN